MERADFREMERIGRVQLVGPPEHPDSIRLDWLSSMSVPELLAAVSSSDKRKAIDEHMAAYRKWSEGEG